MKSERLERVKASPGQADIEWLVEVADWALKVVDAWSYRRDRGPGPACSVTPSASWAIDSGLCQVNGNYRSTSDSSSQLPTLSGCCTILDIDCGRTAPHTRRSCI